MTAAVDYAADLADRLPALAPPTHVLGASAPMASWPLTLVIAIERTEQAAYTWDDTDVTVAWDDADPDRLVWDEPTLAGGFTDAACDMIALDVDAGEPDELGIVPAAELTLSLANDAGQWTAWSADGRLVYWALGRRLYVWATVPDLPTWWIFAGRVATWHENADGTVTVGAFDGFAELAQPLTSGEQTWTAGADGDDAYNRILAIAAAADYADPIVVAEAGYQGDVPLKARPSVQTPLDECHIVALSDGGILYPDANGSLVYADRRWRAAGRPDQAAIPVVSDNVCDPAVLGVWDTDLALEDASVAEYVELINDDGLVAVASSGSPIARRWRLTHPEPDLWIYQSDGDALAAFLLSILERRAMRLGSFVIHLVPQRPIDRDAPVTPLSVAAAPLRRGDLVQFVHDFTAADGAAGRLDQFHRIDCVSHAITPDTWNVRYIASPVIAYATRGLWDVTAFTWDDPDPTNVWSW